MNKLIFITLFTIISNFSFCQEFDLENYKKTIASYDNLRLNNETIILAMTKLTDEERGYKLIAVSTEQISRGKKDGGVYYYLGQGYYYVSKYELAIPTLTKALTYGENEANIYEFRGMSKLELEDYRGAIPDFDKSIKKSAEQMHNLFFYRGLCCYYINDLPKSISDFNKAIELSSEIGVYYFYRGAVYIDMGQKDKGCKDLSTAGEYGYSRAYEFIKEYCNN